MKSLKQKLTTTSLTAVALCLAPLTGLAKDNDNRDDTSTSTAATYAPTTSSAVNHDNSPASDQTTSANAAKTPEDQSSPAASTSSGPQTAPTSTTGSAPANSSSSPSASSTVADQAAAASSPAPSSASPQPAAGSGSAAPESVRVATSDMRDNTLRKYAGHRVRGSDEKTLGKIKDFLVDPASGKIQYAVISTGGVAGIGDKLRLVPFQALQGTAKDKEMSVSVDESQWKQLPTFDEEKLEEGNVTVSDGERRELEQHFASTTSAQTSASKDSGFYTSSISEHLVATGDLKGRKVKSGGTDVGKIDEIVIDQNAGTASALLDPDHNFTKSKEKFIVPLGKLQISGKHDPITTSLAQSDFESSSAGSMAASSGTSSSTTGTSQSSSANNVATSSTAPSSAATTLSGETAATAQANTSAGSSQNEQLTPTGNSSDQSGQSVASTGISGSSSSKTWEQSKDQSVASTGQTSGSASSGSSIAASGTMSHDEAGVAATTPSSDATLTPSKPETNGSATSTDKSTNIASSDTSPSSSASRTDEDASTAAGSTSKSSGNMAASDTTGTSASQATDDETKSSSSVASNSTASSDSSLSPTGQTSADQNPSADPTLMAAARAVRKALDQDPSLASLDVRVTPENGKLVLRGSVTDKDLARSIEQKAKDAANGQTVESKLNQPSEVEK